MLNTAARNKLRKLKEEGWVMNVDTLVPASMLSRDLRLPWAMREFTIEQRVCIPGLDTYVAGTNHTDMPKETHDDIMEVSSLILKSYKEGEIDCRYAGKLFKNKRQYWFDKAPWDVAHAAKYEVNGSAGLFDRRTRLPRPDCVAGVTPSRFIVIDGYSYNLDVYPFEFIRSGTRYTLRNEMAIFFLKLFTDPSFNFTAQGAALSGIMLSRVLDSTFLESGRNESGRFTSVALQPLFMNINSAVYVAGSYTLTSMARHPEGPVLKYWT